MKNKIIVLTIALNMLLATTPILLSVSHKTLTHKQHTSILKKLGRAAVVSLRRSLINYIDKTEHILAEVEIETKPCKPYSQCFWDQMFKQHKGAELFFQKALDNFEEKSRKYGFTPEELLTEHPSEWDYMKAQDCSLKSKIQKLANERGLNTFSDNKTAEKFPLQETKTYEVKLEPKT